MDINAGIIDQQVTGMVNDHPEWLPPGADDNAYVRRYTVLSR